MTDLPENPNARSTSEIASFHAHIYYDAATRPDAERLREAIGAGFDVQLGRWHDEPVGPHPISMYQVAFALPRAHLLRSGDHPAGGRAAASMDRPRFRRHPGPLA